MILAVTSPVVMTVVDLQAVVTALHVVVLFPLEVVGAVGTILHVKMIVESETTTDVIEIVLEAQTTVTVR